ncbi:hypothetical protein C8K30_108107 [Promicromonospora sp. AC04]|nr:hypothetical protein C8K30_108107 [Promicromonospora sp. AC04]
MLVGVGSRACHVATVRRPSDSETRLHHIEIGRTYAGTYVLILAEDLNIQIIDAATGEILRELVLDPTRIYQGTGRPPGPTRK